jgi:cytochrome c oxidase subunit II
MLATIDRILGPVTWLVGAFAVAVLLIGPELVGAKKPPPTKEAVAATAASGKEVFTSTCGGCHTLADAGTNGSTGPSLDETLEGMSAEDIRTAIVDPNAEVAEGFGPNIMPGNYGDTIPKDQLDALVDYLEEQSR